MKKLISLFAILTIALSVSLLFSCDTGAFCCENVHSNAADCSTCSPHIESSFDSGKMHPEFVLKPSIVGQIFFQVINIHQINVTFALDRPPSKLA